MCLCTTEEATPTRGEVCRDTDCITTHRRACSRLYDHACASPRRGIFSGGAKAPTTELEAVRLQSVVRRLRTTDCKRTPPNSTVCAFAPPKKVHRSDIKCVVMKIASLAMHRRACSRNACSHMHAHACTRPRRGIFCGGAKAPTTELEAVRVQSVVRRLRTRDCKRTPSNSVVGALAPAKKMQRSYFSCAVILKMHHPASACLLLCTVRAQEQHGFGRKLLGHRSAGALRDSVIMAWRMRADVG